MKYAVMSDIHCNIVTFNILIQDALNHGINNFLFLGDYVTDGYYGNEILDTIKKLNGTAILGNREKYIKMFRKNKNILNLQLNFKALGYESLSSDSLEYIDNLKEIETIDVNGQRILMLHGDGFDYKNKDITVLYDKLIQKYDFDICLFGHTHMRRANIYKGRTFINPGAVGQPLDKFGFSYCVLEIYDSKQPSVTYRTLEINQDILNKIEKNFVDSNFYERNSEWCELIMASISNSFDFISLFMTFFNEYTANKDLLLQKNYEEIFTIKYQEFAKKYNIDNK